VEVPERVETAKAEAAAAGVPASCEDDLGRLLATLAAGVPEGGRVLVLGAGTGVGTAWIAEGVEGRTDVEVVVADTPVGTFDLAFAVGEGVLPAVGALRPNGALVAVAMGDRRSEWVRRTLLQHPDLLAVELDLAGGVILCTRR